MGKYCLKKKKNLIMYIFIINSRPQLAVTSAHTIPLNIFFEILSNYKYLIFPREMIPIVDIDYIVNHRDKILQHKIAGPKNQFLFLYLEII